MPQTVAAVVVTYNRKRLLTRCIKAILAQTQPVDEIFIIDNHSSDGTSDHLATEGLLAHQRINYIRLPQNTGGAGGFYEGMKRAHSKHYDWLWLMDDDGYPAPECLENLWSAHRELDVIGPAVVVPEAPHQLSWNLRRLDAQGYFNPRQYVESYQQLIELSPQGIYANQANFFNAVLISKQVIDTVGYVKKDFFIWGDEYEYSLRIKKRGLKVGTQVNSLYYHPANFARMSPLKYYYFCRNIVYIYMRYSDIMYRPLLRYLYPIYIIFLAVKLAPSYSPKFLLSVIWATFYAMQGKLLPWHQAA